MNIWILNQYAVPENGSGGTRHAVLGRYLHEAGHRVTIFPGTFVHANGPAIDLPNGNASFDRFEHAVRFRYVPTRPFRNKAGRLLNMLSYRRSVCRCVGALDRPDVIIGSCVHPLAVDAAIRLARRYAVPFVYEIRDVWPESLVDTGGLSRWHPMYQYFRHLELRAFRAARGVIVLFPGMWSYTDSHGVARDRVAYVPNGVDPTLFQDVDDPPPPKPFVVSYFGAHGLANGLGTVLAAARLLQQDPRGADVRIRLVGEGPEKRLLERQTDAWGLDNVEFLDPVPKAQLAPLAQSSHAFLFHLRQMPVLERYGIASNKLFDYLMAARPILFACRSYNNPVQEAKAGLTVPPQDPIALANAILRLRDLSAEQRRQMGTNGRAYVMQHHNLADLATRLDTFLRTIVSDWPASHVDHSTRRFRLPSRAGGWVGWGSAVAMPQRAAVLGHRKGWLGHCYRSAPATPPSAPANPCSAPATPPSAPANPCSAPATPPSAPDNPRSAPTTPAQQPTLAVKRCFDLAAASVLLVLLSLPLALVALAVRLAIGPSVLFRQARVGLRQQPFVLLKLRSMVDAQGPDGRPLPDTQRLTRLGRFLRRTSLDELPSLVNVIKGEMSLVGPRPLLVRYLPFMTQRERTRHNVRPGITGLAQVMGRNELSWGERLEYDVAYVENWSLLLDVKILLWTLGAVLQGSGVVVDPTSQMRDLDVERRAFLKEEAEDHGENTTSNAA
jgi:lipopolysaccharide/colanic/teichoic acid biosynthesis glycosyltransferase/glycosyltransferase involved in cell wall biosynthesis